MKVLSVCGCVLRVWVCVFSVCVGLVCMYVLSVCVCVISVWVLSRCVCVTLVYVFVLSLLRVLNVFSVLSVRL